MKQVKVNFIFGVVVLASAVSAHAADADATNTVHGIGYYSDAGPGYDEACRDACVDAQTKCLNKSVKRISDWKEWVNRKEGYFTIYEQADFQCLAEAASEENLLSCEQR